MCALGPRLFLTVCSVCSLSIFSHLSHHSLPAVNVQGTLFAFQILMMMHVMADLALSSQQALVLAVFKAVPSPH